ncbi:MAG: Ig-like domain-containing protein [Patescibacteria group bacterium]|nr:Ig-like domain-containing protein [Patescibacteria group bacterium]
MRTKFITFMIALLALPLSIGNIQIAHAQSANIIYQNGLDSYSGTKDATISNQYIEWNEIGITAKTDILRTYTIEEEGKAPYEKRALIKFENISLPAGAVVTDARLTLVVTDWESGDNGTPTTILRGYYLNTPWNINADKLGWLHRDDPSVTWSAEGAKGTGDIISGKSFTMTGFDKSGDQTKIVKLDNEIVQSWVTNPASNQGVLIVNETGTGAGTATIHSAEAMTQSHRPKLQITYTTESATVTSLNENQPPTVSLTSPVGSTNYTSPASVLISANASDDVAVNRVEFYHGTTKLGEDTTAPYQYSWNNLSAGTYSNIMAKAFDNQGLMSISQSITITVNATESTSQMQTTEAVTTSESESNLSGEQSPTVYILSPQNDANYNAPAEINFTAMASDPDGTISRVDFYRGTQKIGEDVTEPYLFRLRDVSSGEYHFSAVAIDNDGNMTGSEAIRLMVKGDNQSPTVYILSPQNDANYNAPAEINFTAMASDPDGTISRVDFYRGTQKIGEDVTEPYLFRLRDVSSGEYHFSAVAIDNDGNMTGSEAVRIVVKGGNLPPQVSITTPANNAVYTSPANITINANASDTDGSISRVDFYRGATKIGEDSTSPYSFNWQNVGTGIYDISAVAIDNGGEMTGSEAVHIIVNSPSTNPPTPPPSESVSVGVDMAMCNNTQLTGNLVYVSTSGNDSNANGSLANPYRTVRTAVDNASAGDTIVLRGGTYIEPSEIRIRVPNVTITSYPGEWAIIDRSSDQENAGVYFYVGSDGGSLKCVEVKGGFYAVSTETMWDWGEANRMGASNIIIENTKLHDSFRDVIKIKPQSDDITIRHNEIYNSSQGQMSGDCNAEGIDNVNGDRTIVAYNHIHNTCSTGVYLKGGATDGIVEHNLIENTGGAGIILGFDTSPEFFDLATNPGYYENIRGIARYNLIKNAGWAGVALYASKDAQVYNNTIVDTASVYHSPIYFGVTFQDWEAEAGRPANINPNIHNNIIVQNNVTRASLVGIRFANELGGLSGLDGNLTINNNCYYQTGTTASFEDGRSDWTGGFTAWRSHSSGESGSLELNPQLNANFKPQNSACSAMGY